MTRPITILATALLLLTLSTACHHDVDLSQLEPEDALHLLDAKIRKDSDNADLYYQRGLILIELGRQQNKQQYFKDAIHDLHDAIKLNGNECDYHTALADAYYSLGQMGSSYQSLQQALKIDADNLNAHLKMGEIAYVSKNYQRALESLNKVTQRDNTNQKALMMKGCIYKEQNDTTNAVLAFRRLIELYPDYEPAYEELGLLYSQRGNKLGLEYLNTALQLQPDNILVLYALGMFYQNVEDADKANEYYVKILEKDPTYKYAWFNRGWMELVLYEDYNNAADFFSKAIECDSTYAEAYYNLGLAYQQLGQATAADHCIQTANSLGYHVEN